MKEFFGTAERQAALLQEIGSWSATRFWGGCGDRARKGVGADCVSFAERVLVNLGAIRPVTWPRYVFSGGGEVALEKMAGTLAKIPNMRRVWEEPRTDSHEGFVVSALVPGDVFLRGFKGDYYHLALFGGGKALWHFWPENGLREASICDRQATRHVKVIYRVYEPAA